MKNKTVKDIIFIICFLLICILPVCKISGAEKSEHENRTLAVYKPLFTTDGHLNNSYGKDFEEWFSDRYFLRAPLIKLYVNMQYFLTRRYLTFNNDIFDKKDNWLFDNTTFNEHFTNEQFNEIAQSMDNLQKYFNDKNTKLYILIIPPKASIYKEELPVYDKILAKNIQEQNNTINRLKEITNCKIIYPYKELKQGKKDNLIFYKQDTHWTDYGAFMGYLALSREIKKDFPQYNIVTLDDFLTSRNKLIRGDFDRKYDKGYLAYSFPFFEVINNKIYNTDYYYYDYIYNLQKYEYDLIKKYKKYETNNKNNLRLLLLGTCFNESLLQFLPYSVNNLLYYRLNSVPEVKFEDEFKMYKRFNKIIDDYGADITVLCISYNNLKEVKHLMDKE